MIIAATPRTPVRARISLTMIYARLFEPYLRVIPPGWSGGSPEYGNAARYTRCCRASDSTILITSPKRRASRPGGEINRGDNLSAADARSVLCAGDPSSSRQGDRAYDAKL